MRSIVTLVLRLFVDDEHPKRLQGALHNPANFQVYPFRDEQALLELLSSLSACSSQENPDPLQGIHPPGEER